MEKIKRRDKLRSKANDMKGKIGGFMGKVDSALKLGAFKSTKLDSLLQHSLSRLAILKNQRRLRCAHGRSDIAQLLQSSHHDLALLRAEYVLNEQNMLEVFDIIQAYCNQVMESYALLKHQKKCPDGLKEPIASLIFASSRCNELPELDDIRFSFSERFGKDFVTSCVELHDCNGANINLIEKLCKMEQSSENKTTLLKEIALEKGIEVDLGESTSEKLAQVVKVAKRFINDLNLNQPTPPNSGVNSGITSGCSSEDDIPQPPNTMIQKARNNANLDYEIDTFKPTVEHPKFGLNEKNLDNCDLGPPRNTMSSKIINASNFKDQVRSDENKTEVEVDVMEHRNVRDSCLESRNMKNSKGIGFGKLASTATNDANAQEEERHHKSWVTVESRTKWKGLAFHMKNHVAQLASEEDTTSKGHGSHKKKHPQAKSVEEDSSGKDRDTKFSNSYPRWH